MVVTNAGLDAISKVIGGSGAVPGYFAIGSGNTSPTTGDTTLEYETDRNAYSSVDTSVNKTITWIGDFTSTEVSGLSLTEFGLLNAASNGNLFHREVIGSIVFDGDVGLQLQTTIKFV